MSIVAGLIPGQQIRMPLGALATFVTQAQHPLWPELQLVIWKIGSEWSHDALSAIQYVGVVEPSTIDDRKAALRRALLHPSQWQAS